MLEGYIFLGNASQLGGEITVAFAHAIEAAALSAARLTIVAHFGGPQRAKGINSLQEAIKEMPPSIQRMCLSHVAAPCAPHRQLHMKLCTAECKWSPPVCCTRKPAWYVASAYSEWCCAGAHSHIRGAGESPPHAALGGRQLAEAYCRSVQPPGEAVALLMLSAMLHERQPMHELGAFAANPSQACPAADMQHAEVHERGLPCIAWAHMTQTGCL